MGHHFPVMGFMVVKDSHNADFAEKKKSVPGLLGCNILRDMQRSLQDELNKRCKRDSPWAQSGYRGAASCKSEGRLELSVEQV